MSLGVLQPPNARGGPSTNLSFSRELSSGEESLRPPGEDIEEDGNMVEAQATASEKNDESRLRFEEMEEKLSQMMRNICKMEERVAEVAEMLGHL
jgi:hypothetical protein